MFGFYMLSLPHHPVTDVSSSDEEDLEEDIDGTSSRCEFRTTAWFKFCSYAINLEDAEKVDLVFFKCKGHDRRNPYVYKHQTPHIGNGRYSQNTRGFSGSVDELVVELGVFSGQVEIWIEVNLYRGKTRHYAKLTYQWISSGAQRRHIRTCQSFVMSKPAQQRPL